MSNIQQINNPASLSTTVSKKKHIAKADLDYLHQQLDNMSDKLTDITVNAQAFNLVDDPSFQALNNYASNMKNNVMQLSAPMQDLKDSFGSLGNQIGITDQTMTKILNIMNQLSNINVLISNALVNVGKYYNTVIQKNNEISSFLTNIMQVMQAALDAENNYNAANSKGSSSNSSISWTDPNFLQYLSYALINSSQNMSLETSNGQPGININTADGSYLQTFFENASDRCWGNTPEDGKTKQPNPWSLYYGLTSDNGSNPNATINVKSGKLSDLLNNQLTNANKDIPYIFVNNQDENGNTISPAVAYEVINNAVYGPLNCTNPTALSTAVKKGSIPFGTVPLSQDSSTQAGTLANIFSNCTEGSSGSSTLTLNGLQSMVNSYVSFIGGATGSLQGGDASQYANAVSSSSTISSVTSFFTNQGNTLSSLMGNVQNDIGTCQNAIQSATQLFMQVLQAFKVNN